MASCESHGWAGLDLAAAGQHRFAGAGVLEDIDEDGEDVVGIHVAELALDGLVVVEGLSNSRMSSRT